MEYPSIATIRKGSISIQEDNLVINSINVESYNLIHKLIDYSIIGMPQVKEILTVILMYFFRNKTTIIKISDLTKFCYDQEDEYLTITFFDKKSKTMNVIPKSMQARSNFSYKLSQLAQLERITEKNIKSKKKLIFDELKKITFRIILFTIVFLCTSFLINISDKFLSKLLGAIMLSTLTSLILLIINLIVVSFTYPSLMVTYEKQLI